jgi:YidC/Oxa1 family membrane protein insertase
MSEQRNLILAIVLCIAVLALWEIFVARPQMERYRQTQPAPAAEETVAPGKAAPAEAAGTAPLPREEALSETPRIVIGNDASRVDGSLSLDGAKIDDLSLKGYRVSTERGSPEVTLLSPRAAEGAYYASFGFVAAGADAPALPSLSTRWQVQSGDKLAPGKPLTLFWDNGAGLHFTRTITLDEDYMFTITDRVENSGASSVSLSPFGIIARHGVVKSQSFWILHEGFLGVFNRKLETYRYKKVAEDGDVTLKSNGGWLGITDKYWMTALVPDPGEAIEARFLKRTVNGTDVYQADYTGAVRTLAPGGALDVTRHLFAGAKEAAIIDRYMDSLNIARFDLAIDWGWFYFLTRPVFWALDHLNKVAGNFGIAILLLTVVVKLLFFPLANRSYEAMSKMKKLQPEMLKLRERYKDDKLKQQQELMALYKREKVNPLAGCLPILIQIPVFFALYKVLFVTIEMRHAPFFGWIKDLSAADPTNLFNLFGLIPWDPTGLPLIGSLLHLGIWPIIMGATMFLQTKMNPAPADPIQEKIFLWMPVIFTFMLASFPAGLVIYWAWNNLLSILQQYVIMRRMGVDMEWDKKFAFMRRLKARAAARREPSSQEPAGE